MLRAGQGCRTTQMVRGNPPSEHLNPRSGRALYLSTDLCEQAELSTGNYPPVLRGNTPQGVRGNTPHTYR